MSRFAFLIVLLFSVFSFASAEGGKGYLLAHKTLKPDTDLPYLYAEQRPITVNITLYNVGDGSAYSVYVADQWPSTFSVSQGSLRQSFDEIPANSSVSYNYTVVPTEAGPVEQLTASVEYQPVADGPVITAYSSPALNVTVVSAAQYEKITAKHVVEWLFFSFIFGAAVLLPLALWLQIQTNFQYGLPKAAFASSKSD